MSDIKQFMTWAAGVFNIDPDSIKLNGGYMDKTHAKRRIVIMAAAMECLDVGLRELTTAFGYANTTCACRAKMRCHPESTNTLHKAKQELVALWNNGEHKRIADIIKEKGWATLPDHLREDRVPTVSDDNAKR